MSDVATLDCQRCGVLLHILNAAEAARVAARPSDFVLYCSACRADAAERVTRPSPAR